MVEVQVKVLSVGENSDSAERARIISANMIALNLATLLRERYTNNVCLLHDELKSIVVVTPKKEGIVDLDKSQFCCDVFRATIERPVEHGSW